jgi:hypothetical protein
MRKLSRSEAKIPVAFSADLEKPLLYCVLDFAAQPPPAA